MKKSLKSVIAVVLALGVMMTCLACNKMPDVKKAFEKEGWTYSTDVSSMYTKLLEEMNKEEAIVTPHVFKKDITDGVVLVLEFKSTKEMEKQIAESETLKGFLVDSQKSEYVNGNCVLVSLSLKKEVKEIFKKA